MKEIFIGNYGLEQVGQTMTATGWVANIRNHGKLAFIELRDREGLLQVFVGGEIEDFAKLEDIGGCHFSDGASRSAGRAFCQ